MASTYEPIATTTLGANATTITFNSISSAYTDLRLVLVALTNNDGKITFNSDTATNYSQTYIYGEGSAANSGRFTNQAFLYTDPGYGFFTAGVPVLYTVDIFSYAGSTYKTTLQTNNDDRNGSGAVERSVGLWRNTAAITRIDITSAATNGWLTGTTATLYGIKAA